MDGSAPNPVNRMPRVAVPRLQTEGAFTFPARAVQLAQPTREFVSDD